ncbi:hypothetical protein H6P81_012378 [Aristolochia fimbriata]|uniref:Protein TIFY n=1 Tax=Aristolochia fimbriata TaxID=158543 RepID=A0AAV7EBM4_ARIFI|nr:hypothetical protein H6P81_012378 [Aristolochia fimbriata]
MSRAAAMVEVDFFGMEKDQRAARTCEKPIGLNVRGIQNAIARIDPQVLKTVFANGSFDRKLGESNCYTPKNEGFTVPEARHPAPPNAMFPSSASLPYRPLTEASSATARPVVDNLNGTAPLTIFYNGNVSVFDVSPNMAERIMKLAETRLSRTQGSCGDSVFPAPPTEGHQLLEDLNRGGLPMRRKHSLQRFLEKRKERLNSLSPYASASSYADKQSVESVGSLGY